MTDKNKPWVFGARDQRHRGVEVEGDNKLLTVSQAIVQGGLDWLVELRDPVTNDDDAVEAPEWRQVVKIEANGADDKGSPIIERRTLGMVRGRYTILQNRAAFTFFDDATVVGAATIKAVGHLDHGRVVWAVAQRPETMELLPGDNISANMILLTAHDGSHAVKVMFNAYRGATGTMLGFKGASRQKSEVRVRHTKSIDTRMRTLHNVLDAETGYFQRWRTALVGDDAKGIQGFKQRIVTQDEVAKVVDALFPAKEKLDEDGKTSIEVSGKAEKARELIQQRIEDQQKVAAEAYEKAGQKGPQGVTALDVFLGVAEYVGKDRTAKNEGNNWVVSTFGSGAQMRQKAFDLIAGL
jgi:hypothetical protein